MVAVGGHLAFDHFVGEGVDVAPGGDCGHHDVGGDGQGFDSLSLFDEDEQTAQAGDLNGGGDEDSHG